MSLWIWGFWIPVFVSENETFRILLGSGASGSFRNSVYSQSSSFVFLFPLYLQYCWIKYHRKKAFLIWFYILVVSRIFLCSFLSNKQAKRKQIISTELLKMFWNRNAEGVGSRVESEKKLRGRAWGNFNLYQGLLLLGDGRGKLRSPGRSEGGGGTAWQISMVISVDIHQGIKSAYKMAPGGGGGVGVGGCISTRRYLVQNGPYLGNAWLGWWWPGKELSL